LCDLFADHPPYISNSSCLCNSRYDEL
jgi:hypothetical protein